MWGDTGNYSARQHEAVEKRSFCKPKRERWLLGSEFDPRSSRNPSVPRTASCAQLPVRLLLNRLEHLHDIPIQ